MDMSQENFAEILGRSLAAYKKIESGCNGISVSVLRKLREKFSISSDYLLYGSYEEYNNVMDVIQNCKEADKMRILLELTQYFVEIKKKTFPEAHRDKKDNISESIKDIFDLENN